MEGSRFLVLKVVVFLIVGVNGVGEVDLFRNVFDVFCDVGVNMYVVVIGGDVDLKEFEMIVMK